VPDADRQPYPSDLTDAEWAALEPLLPPPSRRGRPLKWARRLMAEAIFYLVRSGCAWRMLPRHFPPWPTVYSQFARWRRDGTLRRVHDRLRGSARAAEGRSPEPSAAIIDSQTARSTGVGGPARGYDPAKRLAGRKRHLLVDASGLVLVAHVHAADLHDRLGAQALVASAAPTALPRLGLVWGDGAYTGTFARWLAAERGWRVEVPRHRDRQLWRYGLAEGPKGFQVIPRRWVVERTFAWLSRARRLARDYERCPRPARR
jgi:putative transposase